MPAVSVTICGALLYVPQSAEKESELVSEFTVNSYDAVTDVFASSVAVIVVVPVAFRIGVPSLSGTDATAGFELEYGTGESYSLESVGNLLFVAPNIAVQVVAENLKVFTFGFVPFNTTLSIRELLVVENTIVKDAVP